MITAARLDLSPTRAWLALGAVGLPLIALSADLNGVAVLLPQMGHDLGASTAALGAVVTVAALGFAAPLLLVGRVADRFGARTLLLVGVVGFAVSATICALAADFATIIVGRALQGVAAACCFTTSLAVIDAVFPSERRALAIGLWGALGGVGSAIGPLVAGSLATVWSWRAFFAVNIPFGIVSFVLLVVLVPRLPADPARRLDLGPLGLLTVGVALAVAGLQHVAPGGWISAGTIVPLVLGAVALVAVARRPRPTPLVPSRVTRARTFRAGTMVATAANWGAGVVLVLVPVALQSVRHTSVLQTGVMFLSFSIAYAIAGAASGPLVRALGGDRAMSLGLAVLAAGLALLAVVGPDGRIAGLLVALTVAGAGNGLVYSASTSVALADVVPADAGEASGLLTMLRLLGLTVGVALSTSLAQRVDDVAGGSTPGLRTVLAIGAGISVLAVVALRVGPLRVPGASAVVVTPGPAPGRGSSAEE